MRIRFAWQSGLRRLWPLLVLLLVCGLAGSAGAQTPATSPAALESAKQTLERAESALVREDLNAQRIADLRDQLAAARDALRARLSELEPQLAEAEARLKQLGPAPAKDAPPETAALAAEREQLTQAFAGLDAAVKQSRLLAVQADQIADRLTGRRHALYAREILERSPSAFDLSFWMDVAASVPEEFRKLGTVLSDWGSAVRGKGWLRIVAAFVCIGGLLVGAALLRQWWRRHYAHAAVPDTRFAKARAGLWVFVSGLAFAPLVTIGVTWLLDLFGLWAPHIGDLGSSLVAAVLVAAFGRAAARALLAPERPERRLFAIDERTAASLAWHMTWSARTFGAAIVLQVLHKSLAAPLVLTIATNVLFAAAVAAFIVHLITQLGRIERASGEGGAAAVPGLRPFGWIVVAVLLAALATGYAGLAGFVALRTVVAAALGSALYVCLVTIDALFAEVLSAETPRGRALAANLGIAPRSVGLLGTLLSAALRIVLVVLALALIFGPWEASTADLLASMRSVPLGFKVGEISVSFAALVSAVTVLMVVLAATRVTQRWLQARFLPQTTLEPSLQLSIATIFGYIGIITAVALALGSLGIDLQKIALVAGALSVGIGFGLQSIVSNFVCGLILLAERPIRVGDWIIVKGEEGFVRRIRVRATEVETFERASVIIPNSELITGLVKNWTHADTMGRVIIKVGVGYDSDPEKVRDILEGLAKENANVLRSPPPRALLLGFGDSSLDFELRCIIANVDQSLNVRSDLHFAILRAFRAAGVEIPFPQRDVHLRRSGDAAVAAQPG